MRIIAVSDLHGELINIKDKCDVFVIAGDWSPLYIQNYYESMIEWIDKAFIPWMISIDANYVLFIPGNHDFVCTSKSFKDDIRYLLYKHNAGLKIHYLCHDSIVFYGKKFYGNPNNESPNGWAYANQYNQIYEFDSNTDILITHQPPKIGDVGYVSKHNLELGSSSLRDAILNSNIEINICGHIHTGHHGETPIILNNDKVSSVYNVSILDEDYIVSYEPTIIEI